MTSTRTAFAAGLNERAAEHIRLERDFRAKAEAFRTRGTDEARQAMWAALAALERFEEGA